MRGQAACPPGPARGSLTFPAVAIISYVANLKGLGHLFMVTAASIRAA